MGGIPSKIKSFVHKTTTVIEKIPKRVKIYIVVIVGCAALAPFIFYLIGFTPVIAKGSLAAAWHASIGNVAAGSIFATLQSLGTAPSLLAAIGALIGAVRCFIHSLWKKSQAEDQDSEDHQWCIWRSEKAQKRL